MRYSPGVKRLIVPVLQGYVLMMVTSVIFALISEQLMNLPAVNQQVTTKIQFSPLYALIPVVLAPIIEELLFRYLLVDWLAKKYSVLGSCLISSLIFSVLHLDWFFLPYFVNGLIFCLIRQRSQSILSPILTHSLYNGSILLLLSGVIV